MRLRLTVQRYGLPQARVIWTIAAVRPPFSDAGPEPTIAQLLEQVNEIIPLESEDWGLEDYAVEVDGFECLHFSATSQVFKEDDEICIRPLSTSDLRCRRISGRDQISSDGRHLTDGVAFGRPLLRRPVRPGVHIPPRKRRRLTYDEDDEQDFEAESQLVVHPGLGDELNSLSESEDSEFSVNASDDEEDLRAELTDIRHDHDVPIVEDEETDTPSRSSGFAGKVDSQQLDAPSTRRSRKVHGLGLSASTFLIDENGRPYPETYDNPLLDMFADDESVGWAASLEHAEPEEAVPTSRQHPRHRSAIVTRIHRPSSEKSPAKNGNKRCLHESELDTPVTVRLGSSDDSGDDDFKPSDDLSMIEEESDKENITPNSQTNTNIDETAGLGAKVDSSFSSESDSDTDDTSSSGSSSSDTSSLGPEAEDSTRTRLEHGTRDQETSSSESSSSSDTSSGYEDGKPSRSSSAPEKAVDATTQKKIDNRDGLQGSRVPVPPGAGQKGTQKRNQRRRDHKKLLRLQESGELPSNATTADLHAMEAAQFESRRQNLLQAISSGGVDIANDPQLDQTATFIENQSMTSPHVPAAKRSNEAPDSIEISNSTLSPSENMLVDVVSVSEPGMDFVTHTTCDRNEKPAAPDVQASGEGLQSQTHESPSLLVSENVTAAAQPRMRLDMNSSRRLLFGALGHRAPKTKDDEARLQEKLRKEAGTPRRPAPNSVEDNSLLGANSGVPPAENIIWQDKIELSAVECCHDGITLSTPPFPFVQRWDPQQQGSYGAGQTSFSQRSKKRKRNNRNYEISFEPLEDDAVLEPGSTALNDSEAQNNDVAGNSNDGQVFTDCTTGDENLKAANDQLLRETKETYGDIYLRPDPTKDLPELPEDVSALPDLKLAADCSAGMVIAFKQLDMSAKTNWQPIMSEYRTALVNSVLDDGTLSMTTALRDQSFGEPSYDPDTGERIYKKFEMPGYNEDENDDSDGLLELAFVELIDPKLVQAPEKISDPLDIDKRVSDALPVVNGGLEGSEKHANTDHQSPMPSNIFVHQTRKDVSDPQKDAEATEQVRQEIQDLIKDAGWRSSIQSNGSAPHDQPDESLVDQDYGTDYGMDESYPAFEASLNTPFQEPLSPRFNGFSSSPGAETDHEGEDRVKYPNLRRPSFEPDDGVIDDPDRTMADTSSQVDAEAMQAIRQDFEKDLKRPAASKRLDRHLDSPPGTASSAITSPEADQEKSSSPSAETYPYSNTIPDSQPPPSNPATTLSSSLNNNPKQSSSDNDDLPDLSVVFSSFNSQRAASSNITNKGVKAEHHSSSSDEASMSTLPSHRSTKIKKTTQNNNKPPSSSAPARTSTATARTTIARPTLHHRDKKLKPTKPKPKPKPRPNKYEAAPRSSQDWIGTQVVDLTLSSDPIDFAMEGEELENIVPYRAIKDESDVDDVMDEGSSLPKGEGWVSKNKMMKVKQALRRGGKVGGMR
ncbi:MAG: hypothetical protein Q9168_004233 [Polycauliona sp. 1 TL-2023]